MAFDKNQFAEIIEEFKIDGTRLHEVAADFRYDLRQGLEDPSASSLRILKSYVCRRARRRASTSHSTSAARMSASCASASTVTASSKS